jgi:hypothetical protein
MTEAEPGATPGDGQAVAAAHGHGSQGEHHTMLAAWD